MKQNKKNNETSHNKEQPLFTGDYTRDSSVTEYEKAAEVAKAIGNIIEKRRIKKKK